VSGGFAVTRNEGEGLQPPVGVGGGLYHAAGGEWCRG
jgi:hypothetical protein